jgi:RND family efflux transporter MFP subunit
MSLMFLFIAIRRRTLNDLMHPVLQGSQSCIAAALLVLVACIPASQTAAAPRAAPVEIMTAVEVRMAPLSWLPGSVIGRDDARISAEVEGVLQQVADVGDRFEQGNELGQLEPTSLRLELEEASAAIPPIEARIRFYEREVERLGTLTPRGNVAENLLDEMIANRDEARGQLRVAEARLARIRDRLNRTVIRAPFNGVVMERYRYPGERVTAGEQILRLVNTERLEVQVRIPGSAIRMVQAGDSLQVMDNEHEINGIVRTIVPVGDDASRLYELRLSFEGVDWLAGHPVRVGVPLAIPRKVVAVHRDALVIRREQMMLYRVDADDNAELLSVTAGAADGNLIEIHGPIEPGDRIILRGNERLQPGQAVHILNPIDMQ